MDLSGYPVIQEVLNLHQSAFQKPTEQLWAHHTAFPNCFHAGFSRMQLHRRPAYGLILKMSNTYFRCHKQLIYSLHQKQDRCSLSANFFPRPKKKKIKATEETVAHNSASKPRTWPKCIHINFTTETHYFLKTSIDVKYSLASYTSDIHTYTPTQLSTV